MIERRKPSSGLEAKIVEYFQSHPTKTSKQIAAACGCSIWTVRSILHKNGLKRNTDIIEVAFSCLVDICAYFSSF